MIETFRMFFFMEIAPVEQEAVDALPTEQDEQTAVIGFSGAMRGACYVRMSSVAAASICSAMLGGEEVDPQSDAVADGLGELCNLVAGGWKNGIPSLSSECSISPPTIISGSDYKIHINKPSLKYSRAYLFNGHAVRLTFCYMDPVS